jgi:hypothetical protein
MAAESPFTVQPDGSLAVPKPPGEDTAALDVTVSSFAEPARTTATHILYQLTAASIWRARRQGLSLAEIVRTLETHSHTAIPDNVRADIERWSRQIDRLTVALSFAPPSPQMALCAHASQPQLAAEHSASASCHRSAPGTKLEPAAGGAKPPGWRIPARSARGSR